MKKLCFALLALAALCSCGNSGVRPGSGSGADGRSRAIDAELLAVLYFEEMNIDPADPKMPGRDRFVCSKGHAGPAVYAALANRGYFDRKELLTLNQGGTNLPSHCDMNRTVGVDMTTGSLGQGVSCAAGMALSAKYQKKDLRVYTLLGDGEIEEGQVWEALMFAHQHKLDNLCVIVDNNGLQIDGRIEDVMSPYPIVDKLRAFGLEVTEIDGSDFEQMEAAFAKARETKGVPSAIVMKTTKGKGVSFMEGKAGWHGKAPNDEEYETAMNELKAALAEWEAK